jgi:hypothetical protein
MTLTSTPRLHTYDEPAASALSPEYGSASSVRKTLRAQWMQFQASHGPWCHSGAAQYILYGKSLELMKHTKAASE